MRRACVVLLLSWMGWVGCRLNTQPPPYANDPLLKQRRPVAGEANQPPTLIRTTPEPSPPPRPNLPTKAEPTWPTNAEPTWPTTLPPSPQPVNQSSPVMSQTSTDESLDAQTHGGTERLVPIPSEPIQLVHSVQSNKADLHSQRSTSRYAHHPEYRWLRGVLDRHYRGSFYLRYRDPTEDDPHGGKVLLEPDQRLSELPDGTCLLVEGELAVSVDEPTKRRENYPRYRIHSIQQVGHDD